MLFRSLSENSYPGWRARIDDRETTIYQADGSLQGVVIPGGTHDVEFVFAPVTLRIGAALTLASIVGIACCVWIAARRAPNMSSSAE